MPGKAVNQPLPSPWKEFFEEIDGMLTERLELHCIGGFAFVYFCGLPRSTGDVDYFTAIPNDVDLEAMAGRDSPLHKKYKIYLQRVTVVTLPEDYEQRLMEMVEGQFKKLKLFVPDPYDLILSKLQRGSQKDFDDAAYLFQEPVTCCRPTSRTIQREIARVSHWAT